ncbi:LPXTG cell wall anchor domain-containing protein, partial [Bacillus sp. D-CC]
DTGTVTKEEATQQQQDKAKKEEAIKIQQKSDAEKKQAAQVQEKSDMAKKEEVIKAQEKNNEAKKDAMVKVGPNGEMQIIEIATGEKLPNTASNNVEMMGLSACLVAIGTLFGLNRRNKVKA